MARERIGVIGLGRMGAAMAVRLRARGWTVTGWTRSGRAAAGVAVAPDLPALVAGSDLILTSLFDDAALRGIGERLADLPLDGRLVVETSTVAPETVRGIAPALEGAGARMIDAPVSGGPDLVAEGRAGLFVGGAETDVARFAPVAGDLATRAPHVGALGTGAAAKIVNNMMLCGMWQTLKESLQVGVGAGLEPGTLLEILKDSPAACPALLSRMDVLAGESARVGFPVAGARKDMALFLVVAEALGLDVPAMAAGHESFAGAERAGLGAHDLAVMPRASAFGA